MGNLARAALLFIAVIFQHFQLVSVFGYPVTVGLIAGAVLVMELSVQKPLAQLTVVWATLIAVNGISTLIAGGEDAEILSYVRTLALVLISSAFITFGMKGIRRDFINSRQFSSALLASLVVVVALAVVQVATGARGSSAFFNVFGPYQYLYNYEPYLAFNPIPRAHAFYLEPSYAAFIIGTVAVCLIGVGKHTKLAVFLALVGLLATRSATGLLIFLIVLACMALRSRPIVRWGVVLVGGLFLVVAWPYLSSRLATIGLAGSSANYRLVAPLEVLEEALENRPLGFPFGSIDQVIATFDLKNGELAGTSLDNGIYVLVFYFGWIGALAVLALFVLACSFIFKRTSSGSALPFVVPVWAFGSLLFSGGIVLPEYAFMVWLAVGVCVYGYSAGDPDSAPVGDRESSKIQGLEWRGASAPLV